MNKDKTIIHTIDRTGQVIKSEEIKVVTVRIAAHLKELLDAATNNNN